VTHIIAEHLSTAKANIFKRQRNPTPVVSPKWIVDSIAQQCLLPYVKYLIEEVKDRGQQKGIKELFAAGGKAPSLLAKTTQQDSTMQSNAPSKLPPTSVRTNQEYSGESKSKISMNQNIDNAITEQTPKPYRPTVSNDGTKQNTDLPSKVDSAQAAVTKPPLKPQGKINDKLINGRIRTVGTDPNFVNSYFSSSRLSFIGSYKQRTANVSSPSKASRKDTAHLDRYVFHVDMDCFFASVALRNFPQYKDKPVVISHHGKKKDNVTGNIESEFAVSKKSTSECATCNYKAREFGIKKGMFLGRAKELCPDLIILNYDFDGYQEVSEQVSEIINRIAGEYFGSVENVSCDESYVELMLENHEQAATIAESIRTEILQVTDCSASVGVADNKFLAKLGTDRVKPNGSYVVTDYRTLLADLKLRDLPGIGWRSEPKLAAEGLTSVHDVWDLGSNASPVLGRVLGAANGKKICMYCQGKDDRSVEAAKRKTIGAECNYGVRFDGPYGIDHFMQCLADEVQKRMENVGVKGRQITLKVKQRKKGAKNPPKVRTCVLLSFRIGIYLIPFYNFQFLGHGSCHSLSRSMEIPGSRATCDAKVISRVGMSLLKELAIPLDDVRGMGIVMSKLSDEEKSTSTELTNWFTVENQKKAPLGENNFTSEHHDEQVNKSADEQDDSPTDVQNISALEILDEDDVSVVEIDDNMGVARDLRNDYDDNQSQNSVIEDEIGNSLTIREALTQIALPPLSQIRMSQVEELPTAMQLQIRSRIEQQGKEKADQSNDQEVIQIDNADPPSREANSKRNNRGGSASPAKARSAQRNSLSSNDLKYHRFRQTDVKEMFKLAAVEAGAEPTEISLEVFNQLPMDIKLQIVNGDSFARNFTDVARGTYLLSNKDHMNSAVSIDDSRTQENNKVSQGNYIDENNKFCAEATSDATKDNATQENSSDSTATNILGTEPPANLYEEDILPLKLFLNENSSLNPEAIQLVTEFLTICLQEGRSKDMVTMVRNIRKRGDGWSEDAVLSEIFQTLDKEYLQLHGAHLDRDWIMGTKKM
jgi:DNA repair protein REV1